MEKIPDSSESDDSADGNVKNEITLCSQHMGEGTALYL